MNVGKDRTTVTVRGGKAFRPSTNWLRRSGLCDRNDRPPSSKVKEHTEGPRWVCSLP